MKRDWSYPSSKQCFISAEHPLLHLLGVLWRQDGGYDIPGAHQGEMRGFFLTEVTIFRFWLIYDRKSRKNANVQT